MSKEKNTMPEISRVTPTGDARDQLKEELSIAKIEMKIETLKSSPKAKTKAIQSEIKRLKTVLNNTYNEYKHRAMEFEKHNTSNLLFVRSTSGFHKLFGRSLLFYAFDIAPKLGLEARIYSDGDYEAKSDAGVTSFRGLEGVESGLNKLGAKRIKLDDNTGNIVMFKLPWEYSEAQIERYEGQNTYKLQKFNHVIITENVIPVLYLHLDDLLKAIYENVRRMEPVGRETLGNLMVVISAEMKRIYIEMANGRLKVDEGLRMIMSRINKLKSQLKIIVDLKIWNARVYARIGEIIIKTQEILEMELKKK